ncbi:MAG: methyl-accepting chemotaxis protein [Spirochaetes bacterium]|nr:methyl-accepting chemotaxis protein [Spirochaetota bacterium]
MSGKLTRISILIIFTFLLALGVYFTYLFLSLSLNNYSKETMNLYNELHILNKEHEVLFINKHNDFTNAYNQMNNIIIHFENFFNNYKSLWQRKIFIRNFKQIIEPLEQEGDNLIAEYKEILKAIELLKSYKLEKEKYFFQFASDQIKSYPEDYIFSEKIELITDSLNNNKLNISFFSDSINSFYTDLVSYNMKLNKNFLYLTLIIMAIILSAGLTTAFYLLYIELNNIKKLSDNLFKISKDELAEELVLNTKDELDDIANNIKSILNQSSNLYMIKSNVNSLVQINESVNNMKNSIKEELLSQKQQISSISNDFKELVETMTIVSDNALKTNFITLDTKHKTTNSSNTIKETLESFKTLSETATKIFGILKIINSITEQTELLSLSASIEAARAGEIGKGFNIVANEIRKLSDSTILSTKEISNFGRLIIKIIKSTIGKSETSNEALNTIENSIDYIVNSISKISDVAELGSDKCKNIQSEVNIINEHTISNFNNIEKLDNSIKTFSNKVEQLIKLTSKFKFTKQHEISRKIKLREA